MATKTTKTTAVAVKSDIKQLNKYRFSSKFNGGMAVDADFASDTLTIAYVSPMGKIYKAALVAPTFAKVADTLVKFTSKAHETIKGDLKANGSDLVLKAISSEAFRTPLAANLSQSSKDVKAALAIKDEFEATAAAKKAKIDALKKDLANLED